MPDGIPIPVVRRWTSYLAHLEHLEEQDKKWVSSQELARALSLTDSTVRQDLSHLDFSGTAKRGYEVQGLKKTLADALGVASPSKVVIVGAGNLGRALARHEDFPRRGFEVCGLFDCDRALFGRKIGHLVVQSMAELGEVVRREGVTLGILAVPAAAARVAAYELMVAGVVGILNLASVHVPLPPGMAGVEVRIVEGLQELACAVRLLKRS